MPTGVNLSLAGLSSGFNWQSLVTALANAERAPETQLGTNISSLDSRQNAYNAISGGLQTLVTSLTNLQDPNFFGSSTASVSDSTAASASASEGTAAGQYQFNIQNLATSAQQVGTSHTGAILNATSDVSSLVLSDAGFAAPVTAGTFTVNGAQITVATTDTLKQVFDKINTATGGTVAGSYDPSTDQISLNSLTPITLGSSNDTSNFLQAAKLNSNGSGIVSSSARLGSLILGGDLNHANAATPFSDGGSGSGQFTINGVNISFNATSDSLSDILTRITQSSAGVTASYDPANDRVILSNKNTGNLGISFKDVTGNFLQASGLIGGTLRAGQNLKYTVNGGGTLTSQSNTITANSSGVSGLSVTALNTGNVTVTVANDINSIQSTISSFVNQYNQVQTMLTDYTASTTDASGNVNAGTLTGDSTAEGMETDLRNIADAFSSTFGSGAQGLNDIGITSNGNDNTLSLNTATLDTALTSNLAGVKDLFSDPTNGIAVKLTNFANAASGLDGTLGTISQGITTQVSGINNQIAAIELQVKADTARWDAEFTAMETAEAKVNSQLQYLQSTFNSSSFSSNYQSNLSSASKTLG